MELDFFKEDNFQHAVKVAGTLAKSVIVPMNFRGKPEDIFACLMLGAELGFKPMQSLNSIVLIQGNATLKAQTMLAIARSKIKDLSVKIEETEKNVTVTIRRGEDSYTAIWNDDKAAAMGLLSKDNYKKQKQTMLRWRALSEALKIMCSDVLMGLNTFEEMSDLPPIQDYTPRETMGQTLRREVEEQSPIPAEEKAIGPLYRIQHGTTMGGKQLKDFSYDELEQYSFEMKNKKKKFHWQPELINVIDTYLANFDSYREMLHELENENEAVNT